MNHLKVLQLLQAGRSLTGPPEPMYDSLGICAPSALSMRLRADAL